MEELTVNAKYKRMSDQQMMYNFMKKQGEGKNGPPGEKTKIASNQGRKARRAGVQA